MKAIAIFGLTCFFIVNVSMASTLSCTVDSILYPSGLKIGDMFTFEIGELSILTNSSGFKDNCLKAPDEITQKLGVDLILGCGEDLDLDIFVFSDGLKSLELKNIAIFKCEQS